MDQSKITKAEWGNTSFCPGSFRSIDSDSGAFGGGPLILRRLRGLGSIFWGLRG